MALETATYISQLVASNPAHADDVNQGDSHIKLIKAVLQATFPNMSGALTASLAALNLVGTDGSAETPSIGFQSDSTAGFYKASAGHVGIVGRLSGNGAKEPGELCIFPRDPGSTVCARGGTATGSERYILLDGSSYESSLFPDLVASGQVTISGDNFSVDNLCDTGRFIRQFTPNTWAGAGPTSPGQTLSNANASHTHTLTDPGHAHSDSGHSHGVNDPQHSHAYSHDNSNVQSGNAGAGLVGTSVNATTAPAATGISIQTGFASISSSTTGITIASDGAGEARPEAYVAFMCLKT